MILTGTKLISAKLGSPLMDNAPMHLEHVTFVILPQCQFFLSCPVSDRGMATHLIRQALFIFDLDSRHERRNKNRPVKKNRAVNCQ